MRASRFCRGRGDATGAGAAHGSGAPERREPPVNEEKAPRAPRPRGLRRVSRGGGGSGWETGRARRDGRSFPKPTSLSPLLGARAAAASGAELRRALGAPFSPSKSGGPEGGEGTRNAAGLCRQTPRAGSGVARRVPKEPLLCSSRRVRPPRKVSPASCVDSGGPRLQRPEVGGSPRQLSAGPQAACILGEARTESGPSPGAAGPLVLPGLGGDARGSALSPAGPYALPGPH